MSSSPHAPQKSVASPPTPLSDEALNQLDGLLADLALLAEQEAGEETRLPLSFVSADGLFAALALSPRNTSIADWMRLVLGDAQFPDKERTQLCRNLLIQHYQSVVYQLRKGKLQEYSPCIAIDDEDDEGFDEETGEGISLESIDVAGWCAGFMLGYEQQQDGWDERLDEMALSDLQTILALRDVYAFDDAETEAEAQFRDAQAELVQTIRTEVARLLQEPADDFILLIFALHGLHSAMLAEQKPKATQKRTVKRS